MKTILCILIIATLTATMNAEFLEFTKETYQNLRLTDENAGSYEARLINPESDIVFKLTGRKENEIEFEFSSLLYEPSGVKEDKICKHFLGIYVKEKKLLANKEIFCKSQSLTMTIRESECGKQYIVVTLFMDFEGREPFALLIPILKEPVDIDSMHTDNMIKFMKANQVKLLQPFSEIQMYQAREQGAFHMLFRTLISFLNSGLKKSSVASVMPKTQKEIKNSFVTVPTVLPERDMRMYIDTIILKR